jgi:uncharacterized repeat protein (TIGR01451 family)
MKRTAWFGAIAAVAAIVVGLMSLSGSTPVQAAGNGPDITAHASSNIVSLGGAVDVTLATATNGGTVDPFKGYNASVVYSTASLTANSATDLTLTNGFWGGDFCPPASLANNFGGSLTPPLAGAILGCTSLPATPTTTLAPMAKFNFTAIALGVTAVHMVTQTEAGAGANSFSTYTINNDGTSTRQANNFQCLDAPSCGPLPYPGSQAWDVLIAVVEQTPVITMTKTASAPSVVAGQPISFQLTVANGNSPATNATNVTVTDTLDSAAFPGGANVTFSGSTFDSCGIALQVITCTVATLTPGSSATVTVNLAATVASAGGFSYDNEACADAANDPPPAGTVLPSNESCDQVSVQLIPPAVAWSKSPTEANVFITDGTETFTFDEIMTNQGDQAGLGGFSFDLHYDPTQYLAPAIDLAPAMALFTAALRSLDCNIGTPANGLIHVACASTGTFGSGPQWVGPQVMAHVTLTPQAFLVQSIRPNKENGDVSWVKDDQVTVTNTCGQPLNDGSIQPLPGQPECQGNPLQGVGPGGVLTGNPNGGESVQTWRRLEGDVTKDCEVDVSDMQLEASKFGMSVGNLLYNIFYDVNSPLQRGDGEIDINDVQFVYGRFGSACANPIPPQPPVALP